MNVKLTASPEVIVEIDGQKIPGTFYVESFWNGLAKLKSDSPCREIIVVVPPSPHPNPWDVVPPILGGNRGETGVSAKPVSTELVSRNFKLPTGL